MSPEDLAEEAFASTRLDVVALARILSGDDGDQSMPAMARAAGLVSPGGRPTERGLILLDAARAGDLDHASRILAAAHPPYRAYLDALRLDGPLPRGGAAPHLRRRGIRASAVVANSVAVAAVHLGQAYTTLGRVRDGSGRPEPHALAALLRDTAENAASYGLARVSDLMGPACARARMSPHALNAALNAEGDVARLAGLTLSPSAGGPVRARDAVLSSGEDGFFLDPVPADRFRIGERPVLVALIGPVPSPGPSPGLR